MSGNDLGIGIAPGTATVMGVCPEFASPVFCSIMITSKDCCSMDVAFSPMDVAFLLFYRYALYVKKNVLWM